MNRNREVSDNAGDLGSYITTVLLVVVIVFLVVQSILSVQSTRGTVGVYQLAKDEVANQRVDNIELLVEKRSLLTEDSIEIQSRDRLKLSKDEELVFIVPEELYDNLELDSKVLGLRGYTPGGIGGVGYAGDSSVDMWFSFFVK